jgi:hypothetical protein
MNERQNMISSTAMVAKPMDRNGKLYQRRAFAVLPILVRQAATGVPMTYGQIAAEVNMPNHRNLNYVLGSIGVSLQQLANRWRSTIPAIQSLAINEQSRLPGPGFDNFFPNPKEYRSATLDGKRRMVRWLWHEVRAYTDWSKVLTHFDLVPIPPLSLDTVLPQEVRRAFGEGGESPAHKEFKQFVASHPEVVGVRGRVISTKIEYWFASADKADILFTTRLERVAVEVKAHTAPDVDILRGIFQWVKYRALLEATHAVEKNELPFRAILALEGPLPIKWRGAATTLGVEVVERIRR